METADVVKLRTLCEKAKQTVRHADGSIDQIAFPTHVVCDNSLNVLDYHKGNVIWNDADGYFVYFTNISPSSIITSPNSGMSFGSEVMVPGVMICVDYGEIQNIRCEISKEAFMEVAQALNMTQDQIDYNFAQIFDRANMNTSIQRKRMYAYSNQAHKNSADGKRNFTEEEEYNKTVHPVSY